MPENKDFQEYLKTYKPVNNSPVSSEPPVKEGGFADYLKDYKPVSKSGFQGIAGEYVLDSQYDPSLRPGANLEENRAQQQSALDKWGNGIVKAAGVAGTSILENTAGLVYGVADAIVSDDISKVYNNDFTKSLDEFNDYIAKSMPHYHTQAEADYNLIQKLGTANFWSDQALHGAAYMGSAIVTGTGLSRFASLGKLARAGVAIDETKLATEGWKALDGASKGIRIADATDFAKNAALMSHGESAIEARQTYNETKQNLIQDFVTKYGEDKLDQNAMEVIEANAKAASNWAYGTNLAITSTTNALLFPKLLTEGYGANKLKLNNIELKGGQFVTKDKSVKRGIAGEFIKGSFEEGGQELGQLLTQKTLTDYYSRGFKDKEDQHSLVESLIYGLEKTLGTQEGLENFFLGALMGGPAGAIQGRGDVSDQNVRTQYIAQLLNNPEVKKTVNNFDNFVRSTSFEKDKNEALEAGSKFDYLTAEFEQNKSIVKQFLDNGAKDLLIQQYKDMQGMPEEEFKKVAGYNIEEPLPKSQTEIINNAVQLVENLDKTNKAIQELFPYNQSKYETSENYRILATNLWHYSTSIDNMNKRIRDIKNDIYKIASEKSVNIVGDGILVPFAIEGNPLVAQQVNQANKDIILANVYKNALIDSYERLANPKTQKKTLEEIKTTVVKESAKPVEKTPVTEDKVVSDDIMTEDEPTNVEVEGDELQAQLDELDRLEELEMANIQDFEHANLVQNKYESKRQALKEKYAKTETKEVEVENVLHEEPKDVNRPDDFLDLYGTLGLRAGSIYRTIAGKDNDEKTAEGRYFRFLERNPIVSGTKLMVVTKNNNKELYQKILNDNPTAKKFEEENPDYQGVYVVFVDKDYNFIYSTQAGNITDDKEVNNLVYSTLVLDEGVEITRGVDVEKAKKELADFKKELLSETEPVYLDITGKSKGVPIREKIGNKRRQNPVLGHLTNDISRKGLLQLPTISPDESNKTELKNGQIATTGKLYAFDDNNIAYDLVPRTLSSNEQILVTELLSQRLGIVPKTVDNPSEELEKFIFFGVPKKGPNRFTIGVKDDVLYIGTNTYSPEEFAGSPEAHEKLSDLLANKFTNANSSIPFDQEFKEPILSENGVKYKIWDSYQEYLLSDKDGRQPLFGTDIPTLGKARFRNYYVLYDKNIVKNEIKISDEEVKPDLSEPESTEIETPDKGVEKPEVEKDGDLFKIFKKSGKGRKINLDRLVDLVKDSSKILNEEELKWFKENFPNVEVEDVKGLIDGRAFGRFLSSGKILLSNLAPNNTLRHEAWHVVEELYLTNKERADIHKEVKNRFKDKKLTPLEIKEILAEDFAYYKDNSTVLGNRPLTESIFDKILNFIKSLLGLNSTQVRDIYNRLETGYYTNKPFVSISEYKSLDSAFKGKDEVFTKEVLDGMDYHFFDILFENDFTPEKLFQTQKLSDEIFGIMRDEFIDKYEALKNLYNDKPTEQIKNLIASYDYILSNWDTVIEKFSKRIKSLGVNLVVGRDEKVDETKAALPEEGDSNEVTEKSIVIEEEEDYDSSDPNYRAAHTISTKDLMFKQTKLLIRTLPKVDKDGEPILNSLGLPQLVDFNSTYNFLLRNLAGIAEYPDMIMKLKELSNQRPEINILIDRIKESSDTISYEQLMFQNQFRQDFDKNFATSYKTIIMGDGTIYLIDATRENTAGRVKELWRNNIKNDLPLVKLNDKGRLIVSGDIKKIKNKIEFLSSLGIVFSKETLLALENNEEFSDAVLSIKNYLESVNYDVTDLFTDKSNAKGNIAFLTDIEALYTPEINELSFISTEGKTVYSISLNNMLSIVKNIINNAKTKDELFSKLPHLNTVYTQNSLWLKQLFNSKGDKRVGVQINLDLLDGLKTLETEEEAARQTTKLSQGDKMVQELNNILLGGKGAFMRASDKAIEHSLTLSNYTNGTKLAVSIESLKNDTNSEELKAIFRGYFKDELQRIYELQVNGLGKDVDVYRTAASKFGIFEGFPNSQRLKKIIDTIIDTLAKDERSKSEKQDVIDKLYNDSIVEVDQSVVKFFFEYTNELKNKYAEFGISAESSIGIASKLTEKYTFDQMMRALAINDFINSVEQVKLFIGDMAFYKDLFKRTSGLTGTKKTARVDREINSWLDINNKRKDGKLADGKINILVFNDSEQRSNYINEYVDALKEAGLTQEEAQSLLEAYTDMKEGDAQGWITLDEYKEFFIRTGDWTISEELFEKAQRGEELTSEEIQYFMPIKAQYFGPQDYNGLYVPTYHKYSLMPLIPSMVKGKNLETLLETMTNKDNKVGYALFRSGSKVGTIVDNEGNANKFYTDEISGDINTENLKTQVVDYRFLGIQLDISPKLKEEVIFGTQFRKLLFSNLFKGGKELASGSRKLFDEYTDIFRKLIDKEKEKLIKELGVNPNGYVQEDVTQLVKLLKKESEDRNLPDNIIDALDVEEINGKIMLKYNFSSMVNKPKIESMIMSLVNARLIRQMMNGDAMIQGASSGFETKGKRVKGSNELKFYRKDENGKTLPMQVKVPLTGEYKYFLKGYGSIGEINKAIKSGKIDKRLLTMVGYRIPTQGLNSIEFMEIEEFLPESAGNLIILPTEIVAKSGGDFDIDKLNIFRPWINPKSDPTKELQNRVIGIAKEILENSNNFTALITPNSTKILTDIVGELRYISYVDRKIARKEEPTSKKDYLRDLSNVSKNVKYTNQLKLWYKVEQFVKFLGGKAGVGIGALQNTHHILSQIANLSINKSYIDPNSKQEKYVNIYFKYNKNAEGNIDLSELKDVAGKNNISEVISQIINASVDIAKDPFMFDLNMNLNTLSTYLYLIRTGVEFEQIAYFMKQPIITEFLEQSAINKSVFLKAANKSKSDGQIQEDLERKYEALLKDKMGLSSEEFDVYIAGIKNRYDITTEEMKGYLSKNNQDSVAYYHTQLQVLDNFVKYKEQAQMLSDAINSVNHDTAGVGSNVSASDNKLEQKERVRKAGFINNIDNIYNNTFVGLFDQHKFTIDVYGQFYDTRRSEILANNRFILNTINPFKAEDKNKLSTLIENDFINYVIQNYGYPDDISATTNRLFRGDNSLAKKVLRIKKGEGLEGEQDKLKDNLLIKELTPLLADKDHRGTDNIRIYTKRFDTFTANQLTESFREIELLMPDLARDLMDLGIIQSGLNNSPITYLGLIPFEYYGQLVRDAFIRFDKEGGAKDLNKFTQLFIRNNSRHSTVSRIAKKLELGDFVYRDFAGIPVKSVKNALGYGMYFKNYNLNAFKPELKNLTKEEEKIPIKVEQTEYIPEVIDNEEIKAEEVIESPFIPANKEQSDAIEEMRNFINNGNSNEWFMLEGKAGTGKTTIVEEVLAPYIGDKYVLIGALSHKARLVLKDKLNVRYEDLFISNSIAGMLGMKMEPETGKFFKDYEDQSKTPDIKSADIIIIDEASMVNKEALRLIMTEKQPDAKVIFLGDRGQLPPIEENGSEKISEVFDTKNKASLTERVRQGEESPILPYADYFWENSQVANPVENPVPESKETDSITPRGSLVFAKDFKGILPFIVSEFKVGIDNSNPNQIKIVAYRNDTRRALNTVMRERIFGKDAERQFVKGDLIMFSNNYKISREVSISNSYEAQIKTVNKAKTLDGWNVFEISFASEENPKKDVYVRVLSNEDSERFSAELSKLRNVALAQKKKTKEYSNAWKEYYTLKDKFAPIEYGYAVTSHKSQGSTYNTVVVAASDIMSVKPISPKVKSQSIYTALTRAKNTTIVVNGKNDTNEEHIIKALELGDNSKDYIENLDNSEDYSTFDLSKIALIQQINELMVEESVKEGLKMEVTSMKSEEDIGKIIRKICEL